MLCIDYYCTFCELFKRNYDAVQCGGGYGCREPFLMLTDTLSIGIRRFLLFAFYESRSMGCWVQMLPTVGICIFG